MSLSASPASSPANPVRAAVVASARDALRALGGAGTVARVAILPRAAAGPAARACLREAGIECVTTIEGGDIEEGWRLACELVAAQGWALDGGAPAARAGGASRDVIGWYEVRIAHAGALVIADRPITRLHGSARYIASFNLLGQGRLNARCARLLHRRLVDEAIVPGAAFDTVACSEAKAVGLVQELVGRFRLDRYVVLRKDVKNYMPRRPREPLVQEAASITTAGAQRLVLDPIDWPLVEGRRVLLVDDVIATGGTIQAASGLLDRAGARVVAVAALLLKGPEPRVPRLLALARPLL